MISSVVLSVALSTVGFGHHGQGVVYGSGQGIAAPSKHCPTPQAPCKGIPVVPSKQILAAPQAPLKASPQY